MDKQIVMNSTHKTTPKDFFIYAGATIALYASVIALLNLAFSIINYLKPDTLVSYFSPSMIVWPISMLVVLVPILYLLEWLINRDVKLAPEKKDMWVRKWRIYLTIFLVVALISGDLITLINTYLNGEITSRFVYKVIVILIVSSTVGKYYFFSQYESYKLSSITRKICAWFGLVLAIATIVFGFIVIGSPATQRAVRLDNQRINDLRGIQMQVVYYWQQHGTLPGNLDALNDSISEYVAPSDPDTKATYEYSTTGNNSFELCANFARVSPGFSDQGVVGSGNTPSYPSSGELGASGDVWVHPEGHACFNRTIDSKRYPVSPTSVGAKIQSL